MARRGGGVVGILYRSRHAVQLRLSARRCCSFPQVLQRGLPRPVSLDHAPEPRTVGEDASKLSLREAAEALLFSEMRALLQHDAAKYPLRESKKDKKVAFALSDLELV